MNLEDVRADVAAFADDDDELLIDDDGNLLFVRNGQDFVRRLARQAGSDDPIVISPDGTSMSYSNFLTHELARLDTFANKLLERRPDIPGFVDGPAQLSRPAEDTIEGSVRELLARECDVLPAFAARVAFVTADAGHGKTALLRHFQTITAQRFLNGQSPYLFWHVDLQGRQLLRLSEALMGDLGEMRHSGLWMPGVIRLMRRRKLVLAIDGFDELAAEQGGSDALGALTQLVEQLAGEGVIIAAARRTFFDAEDYIRRTTTMRQALASPCQFDQLELLPWSETQALEFIANFRYDDRSFEDEASVYIEILTALGGDSDHPMLTRPFLLSQVTKAMLAYGLNAADFVSTVNDLHSGVAAVVEAFVKREVTNKWVYADTGEPYLTVDQHMELLANVAEEMHRNQKDRLSLDVIQTILAVLLDQWNIEPSRRSQVIDMVRAHVLLVLPPDANTHFRSFDHPEFRDYFVAYALQQHLEHCLAQGEARALGRFLSYAPLSDASARYVCGMVDRTGDRVSVAVAALTSMVAKEWRPSHLHTNVATLVAFLIDGLSFSPPLHINATLIYTSLVLENSKLRGVRFAKSSFVNASLRNCTWDNVSFEHCQFNELRIDRDSTFTEVEHQDCRIEGLIVSTDGEETIREYAPTRIWAMLESLGIRASAVQPELPALSVPADTDETKAAKRFLRMFSRSTAVSDLMVGLRFKGDTARIVRNTVIPAMIDCDILTQLQWKGAGSQQVWSLRRDIEQVLSAEEDPSAPEYQFWTTLRAEGK